MSEENKSPQNINPPTSSSRFDRIIAALALGLSIAALLVSLVEVSAVRSQQRATAWPYIEISESYTDAGFKLRLTNKGVGPALMSKVELKYDGERVESIDSLIIEAMGREDAFSYDIYSSSNPSNSVVAAGETVILFSIPWEERTRKFVQVAGGSINIETCYCSIHNDCWETSLNAASTTVSNSCKTGISS